MLTHLCILYLAIKLILLTNFHLSGFVAHGTEKRQVRLPLQQGLPSGQKATKQMPVLPLPKVPSCGDGERRWELIFFLLLYSHTV